MQSIFTKVIINPYIWICLISLSLLNNTKAQIGGDNVYEFINLPQSARVTALGGSLIAVYDDDVALAYANPAALNEDMHQQLNFNYNFLVADIRNGYVSYGHYVDKWKTMLHGGVQYINYGDFQAADENGIITGSFAATEYAFTIGAGRTLNERISLGTNLKLVSSQLESYSSVGLAADAAIMYRDTASRFNATLVFKNIGGQFTNYNQGNTEPIPFDVQLGVSKKLKHLPFRISVTAHNLQRWNILYDDPNQEQATIFTGDIEASDNKVGLWVDNLFRHLIFSGEFLFGKKENLRMRFAYNHLRRSELSVTDLRSVAGFSFGFGLKIKRFRVDYGRQFYHLAGGGSHLSISTPLTRFKGKKKAKGFG